MSALEAPAVLVLWERVLGDLLDRTARFPKSVRFTFAARIDAHALDILDALIRARFAPAPERAALLHAADTRLAVLRTLVRLSADRKYLDLPGLKHVATGLDEAGRMLGGWRRSLGAGGPP